MSSPKIQTFEQKQNEKAITGMFKGLDDDVLKYSLLVAYAGYDEAILDEIKEKRANDLAELQKQFEIVADKEHPDAIVIPQGEPPQAQAIRMDN